MLDTPILMVPVAHSMHEPSFLQPKLQTAGQSCQGLRKQGGGECGCTGGAAGGGPGDTPPLCTHLDAAAFWARNHCPIHR